METIETAGKLMLHNCYMTTIDLEDAHFLIPIHKNSRKFLRFQFAGALYKFTCLPFGLNISPFIYT